MSLLMEALKKAEESKLQSTGSHQPTASSVASLSADETATIANGDRIPAPYGNPPEPDSAPRFDANDIGIAPAPQRAPARTTLAPADDNRVAARNLFAAKQAPGNNKGLWLIAGLGLFAALGLGGYFWWQLQGIPSRTLTAPPPPASTLGKSSGSSLPDSRTQIADIPASLEPSPQPTPLPLREQKAPGNRLPTNPGSSLGVAAVRTQKPFSAPTASTSPDTSNSPVRLSRNPARTDPALERAYDALQAGRANEAQQDYERVLRNDPKNTDALLGLATIATQQGQIEKAHAYYQRALESNPNDATAQAGVISTRGQTDADFSESRLKTALASQPDSPALLFALGNLYARQGRWSEAQQVYFRAYATDPDNPDFLFNLAVSLDHLRQNKLARQYYQMALTAGETRTVSFDRNLARTRVLELQP